jgi:hypothetical protein
VSDGSLVSIPVGLASSTNAADVALSDVNSRLQVSAKQDGNHRKSRHLLIGNVGFDNTVPVNKAGYENGFLGVCCEVLQQAPCLSREVAVELDHDGIVDSAGRRLAGDWGDAGTEAEGPNEVSASVP